MKHRETRWESVSTGVRQWEPIKTGGIIKIYEEPVRTGENLEEPERIGNHVKPMRTRDRQWKPSLTGESQWEPMRTREIPGKPMTPKASLQSLLNAS